MKFYLAGPMSGYPQYNFPAFFAAAEALRNNGYKIISPAEVDGPAIKEEALASSSSEVLQGQATIAGHTWGDLLARDVKIVADEVGGIIFLPDWDKSRGARLEAFCGLLCNHKFGEYVGEGNVMFRPVEWVKERLL